jgi:hypothetical protein
MRRENAKACLIEINEGSQQTPIHHRHPRAMAKPLSLEVRALLRIAQQCKPRRATARLHLGRASFEAPLAMLPHHKPRTSR